MAAALDEEDLSISLPSYDRDNPSPHHHPHSHNPSHSHSHNTRAAMQPPPRPRADYNDQSPGTARDMQRLDQYTTVKILGEGSFGKVKLAVHQASGRQVALKIIPRRKLLSRDMVGRVDREIQYLQFLRHPHIIKLYTVIATKTDIVMVLEYAERELFDYLVKRGRCNDEEARKFFQQIICAVEYCHRHKIVHRDLKPENLLIDREKNVKIADFGLSNIMTDGNFLKTSCGSPNYAAPEVISGKLYAGPEVDVWSCGVILYVLLVGKLPFDDDYIPALFKKIAAGNFHMPSYVSSGAARLIRAMLQVNSTSRITIPEIRQDPWFLKNLPKYLQPPADEWASTKVDPNRAIDPRRIAPGRPVAVQEKIHQTAISKLQRRMGVDREDINDALKKPEPSAIKDAFFIVVENEMMQTNSPTDSHESPAATPSPDVSVSSAPGTGTARGAKNTNLAPLAPHLTQPSPSPAPAPTPSPAPAFTIPEVEEERVSHVRILPTSLPYVHDQIMDQRDRELHARAYGETMDESRGRSQHQDSAEAEADNHKERSPEEQAATARSLKPHSRSIIDLEKLRLEPPEGLEKMSSQPKRSRKWQFGIRSRNQPYEAMLCLYKAIRAQGGVWEIQPAEADNNDNEPEKPPEMSSEIPKRLQYRYPDLPSDYYIPKDLWFIRARLLKEGVLAPGPSSSSHSSRSDLEEYRRRISLMTNPEEKAAAVAALGRSNSLDSPNLPGSTSTSATATSSAPALVSSSSAPHPYHPGSLAYGVWVFIDIQLYQLEANNFMVDFKCDGYQNVIRVENEGSGGAITEWRPVSKRIRNREKEVTSPYPFLDVASDLVAGLASAN
ncbi:CAMK/CAMKL/AMPK protein kinase [Helicocarpus griseus UAMH5409]|uniref:non-specific serine/threonine protein kinase n=1 Tax=Helicocarpus griseus UAMH5409 TaxID=1447875 RepID=A0A2B7XJ97_9EURO|nr:CAMK/CAMKL/AMPK protein kinase [Helicocarpus griseus UAMH5409]